MLSTKVRLVSMSSNLEPILAICNCMRASSTGTPSSDVPAVLGMVIGSRGMHITVDLSPAGKAGLGCWMCYQTNFARYCTVEQYNRNTRSITTTAAVKSLLTVMALLQQKPWSERCVHTARAMQTAVRPASVSR